MSGLRHLLTCRRWFAAWIVAAALAVRVLVPAGYMPAAAGSLTLMICSGHAMPAGMTMAMPAHGGMAMPAADRHDAGDPAGPHDHSDPPCPFAALAMPTLADAAAPVAAEPPLALPPRAFRELDDARAPSPPGTRRPPPTGPPVRG